MKFIWSIVFILLFTSCDDVGGPYVNPKAKLTAEQFSLLESGDTARYYITEGSECLYLYSKEGVYKAVIISESNLVMPNSAGKKLLFMAITFVLGMLLGISLK